MTLTPTPLSSMAVLFVPYGYYHITVATNMMTRTFICKKFEAPLLVGNSRGSKIVADHGVDVAHRGGKVPGT